MESATTGVVAIVIATLTAMGAIANGLINRRTQRELTAANAQLESNKQRFEQQRIDVARIDAHYLRVEERLLTVEKELAESRGRCMTLEKAFTHVMDRMGVIAEAVTEASIKEDIQQLIAQNRILLDSPVGTFEPTNWTRSDPEKRGRNLLNDK